MQDALQNAQAQFTEAGIETPRTDARLLLQWATGETRETLAREPERPLSPREAVMFAKATELRVGRRPLPYITGEAWFCGRAFKVNRATLIPRPETEDLVSLALRLLTNTPAPVVADIGTGSGCVAVSFAAERPDARVWATDLSPLALLIAAKNVRRYHLTEQITLAAGDLLSPLPLLPFDAIVSNPPYVAPGDVPHLQPEVRDYEPALALSGDNGAAGADGTRLHRRLLQDAPRFLKPGGWLLMEVGQGQSESVCAFAREREYENVDAQADLSGIPRIVLARWRGKGLQSGNTPL